MNVFPNDHRKDDTRNHTAYHTTDGSEHRKLSSLCRILSYEGKHGTIRNVCHCVSCVPNDITDDEECCLNNNGSAGERHKYCCTTYDKADSTNKDVCLELTSLVSSLVSVDHRTDDGVVNSVPSLNEKEKDREKTCFHHHVNKPECLNCALKTEGKVTASVTSSISELVAKTKLTNAVGIKL